MPTSSPSSSSLGWVVEEVRRVLFFLTSNFSRQRNSPTSTFCILVDSPKRSYVTFSQKVLPSRNLVRILQRVHPSPEIAFIRSFGASTGCRTLEASPRLVRVCSDLSVHTLKPGRDRACMSRPDYVRLPFGSGGREV
jgi:hypothetical protein